MIASGFFRGVGEVAMVIVLLSATGCSNLPGKPGTQGAVIGGVGGAAAGAPIGTALPTPNGSWCCTMART